MTNFDRDAAALERKPRRMHRILGPDERTVIVALDHAAFFGAMAGLEHARELVSTLVAGGADAILASYGVASACASAFGPAALILRADGGSTKLSPAPASGRLLYSAEDALRLGADAVACMGYPGSRWEESSLRNLATMAGECQPWQLPLLAEMLPLVLENPREGVTPEHVRDAVRVGAELGADIIRTQYTGTVESFRTVLAGCYAPVVILGGPRMGTDEDLLRTTREALDAGASGVAFGRNIWQHARPGRITAAVAAVVHQGATVEEALGFLA